MNSNIKQQVEKNLFKGQKYDFQGYPQWYNQELAERRPIPLSKFKGQFQQASSFYDQEAHKLHFANHVLKYQLEAVLSEISELKQMIEEVQEHQNSSAEDKKKRIRRCASQIERKYVCPVSNCQKSYGTEGSMAQHMRIKHPGVQYVMAELNSNFDNEDDKNIKKESKRAKKENIKS